MESTQSKPVPVINFSDTGGNKDVIFLVHGFLESMTIWDEFEDELEKEFRIIRIDLPGHGKSTMIDDIHTMEIMAEEIRNIIDITETKKILLVGHSMGGYVSLAFAEKYPEFLKGLVLFHSHAASDTPETLKNRERLIAAVEKDHLSFISSFIPELFAPENVEKCSANINELIKKAQKTPKEGILAAIKGMRDRKDRIRMMHELKIPVLCIVGDQDTKIPKDMLETQVDHSDNTVAVVLEGCGHMGFWEEKEETLEAVKDFALSVFSKGK